ncbi:MAG: YciI family protein [Chthoniobacterales bacterium]
MSERPSPAEYLVISRGQWDRTLLRNEIQQAIDQFYTRLDRLVSEGKMKRGQRLTHEGKTIVPPNVITDGPFGESKEAIGGYWFILANSLDEAVQIAKGNPCLDYGLFLEIRPIDPQPATPDNTRQS